MARTMVITDDLDGSSPAEEVRFTWDGVEWSIDLAEANRKRLEEALQPFLDKAHPAQVAQAKTAEAPKRQRGKGTDWSSPENAGMPHRGRVTPAEADYVRANLDAVNKRREAAGKPLIDPNNPDDQKRYGY